MSTLHGNLVFLPWYEAGLQVFNISNPASPVMVGAFDTWAGTSTNFNGNWGVDLSLGLNRVLLSDRKRGLIVVDASGVLIPGDYNQDMVVNAADYDVWRAAFGSTRSSVHDAPFADGNYDGVVDVADYVVWRDHLGQVQTGAGSGLGGVDCAGADELVFVRGGCQSDDVAATGAALDFVDRAVASLYEAAGILDRHRGQRPRQYSGRLERVLVNDPLDAGVRIAVARGEGVHDRGVGIVPDKANAGVAKHEECPARMLAAERFGKRADRAVVHVIER